MGLLAPKDPHEDTMRARTTLRALSVLALVLTSFSTPARADNHEWPRCDTGGAGSSSCTVELPGGSCSITCSVGAACCSIYDGCYCAYDI